MGSTNLGCVWRRKNHTERKNPRKNEIECEKMMKHLRAAFARKGLRLENGFTRTRHKKDATVKQRVPGTHLDCVRADMEAMREKDDNESSDEERDGYCAFFYKD